MRGRRGVARQIKVGQTRKQSTFAHLSLTAEWRGVAEWTVCEEIEVQAIFMVSWDIRRRGWLKPGNINMIVVLR